MALYHPAWPWPIDSGVWRDSDPYFTAPPGMVPDELMNLLNVATWTVSIEVTDIRGYGHDRSFDFTAEAGTVAYSREGFVNSDTGGEIVVLGTPIMTAREAYESKGKKRSPSTESSGAPMISRGILAADIRGGILHNDDSPCGVPLDYILRIDWGITGGVRSRNLVPGEVEWQLVPSVFLSSSETYLSESCSPVGGFAQSSDGCVFAGHSYGTVVEGFACSIEPATYLV